MGRIVGIALMVGTLGGDLCRLFEAAMEPTISRQIETA